MKGNTDNPGVDAWDRLEGIPDPLENPVLAGHGDVLDHLAAHHASGRMHHAWLVTGPRGIGKATMAARFAAHVFRNPDPATAPANYLPVGPDDATERRIASGAHPNLLHLRRPWDDQRKRWKSRLSVDEIRRLNHFFATTPGQNTWRIVIVDTTDDLNAPAANALLKNLEEPPLRTLFLVLAHSAKGLLATIRSRCQKITMRPLADEALFQALDALGVAAHITDKDRTLIASLSGGSVRRAIILINSGGVELHRQFARLIEGIARPDWAGIHKLASDLSLARNEDRYRLLLDIVNTHVSQLVRSQGGMNGKESPAPVSTLARKVEVWEKTRRSAALTDAYNLDRKQVVLNLFQALHDAA